MWSKLSPGDKTQISVAIVLAGVALAFPSAVVFGKLMLVAGLLLLGHVLWPHASSVNKLYVFIVLLMIGTGVLIVYVVTFSSKGSDAVSAPPTATTSPGFKPSVLPIVVTPNPSTASSMPTPKTGLGPTPPQDQSINPYPWLRFSTSVQNEVTVVNIGVAVRDYATNTDAIASLFNISLGVFVVVGVDPNEDRWNTCILANTNFPEWDGTDNPRAQLHASITFAGSPNAVLQFYANARNGRWRGIASIRTHEGKSDIDQSMLGTIVLNGKSKTMSRREVLNNGVRITSREPALEVTKPNILELGAKTGKPTVAELRNECPGGFTVEVGQKSSADGRLTFSLPKAK